MTLRGSISILVGMCLILTSCRKDVSTTPVPNNPNVINGCKIIEVDYTVAGFGPTRTFKSFYQYDSLNRLTSMTDGQHADTSHYHYQGSECHDDHDDHYHSDGNGNLLYLYQPHQSYQYLYDGEGYIQLEFYTDSFSTRHSYSKSYIWENGNLTSTIQISAGDDPIQTNYEYYNDKTYQVLLPANQIKGKPSKNLIKRMTVISGNQTLQADSYTYTMDGQGKVIQYVDAVTNYNIPISTTYDLTYQCH